MGLRSATGLVALAFAAAFTVPLASIATAQLADLTLSEGALATAVHKPGDPGRRISYEDWGEAVRAGDMAAFIEFARADEDTKTMSAHLRTLAIVADYIVAGDLDAAEGYLEAEGRLVSDSSFIDYVHGWILALKGDGDGAIELHRSSMSGLPGLTADLSLAALLEALDREDQALAVYAALTPGDITAPEHDFDVNRILFSHIQTVISRRTVLLRRLGRIEEAKLVYQRLADAEPEQAVRYAAALESLESGEGFDDDELTPQTALARTIFDLSLAMYQERLIRASFARRRITGFDQTKSALDQLGLLLNPNDEGYRSIVISGLFREAYFDGAAHVALSAPEDTPDLLMSASRSLMLQQNRVGARKVLDRAIKLIDPQDEDEELAIISRASQLYKLLEDEETTLELTSRALELADNAAEKAVVNTNVASALQHFGRYDEAVVYAETARELDDTHDRRVFFANALGEAGEIKRALRILRTELLSRPNDPYALNTLGYFMIVHTEDYEAGYKALARARSLAQNDPYIADSLGWAFYKLGHLPEALRLVRHSQSELAPHVHWEIEDHLGDLLWLDGQKDEARAAWQLALDHYPPARVKADLEAKLSGTKTPQVFERQPLPDLSADDEGAIESREI